MIKLDMSKMAFRMAEISEYSKEYGLYYYLAFFCKFLIALFSIITSYSFLLSEIKIFFENKTVAVGFVVFILFFIELFNFLFSDHSFKLIKFGLYRNGFLLLIIALASFSVSFYLSTNGLAILAAQKVDNSDLIIEKYKIQKADVNAYYKTEIEYFKGQAETIRAQRSYKRKLSADDNKTVLDMINKSIELNTTKNDKLTELDRQMKAELKNNDSFVVNTAEKYYLLVSLILILQLVLSFLCSNMAVNARLLEDSENYSRDLVIGIKNDMKTNIYNMVDGIRQNTIISLFREIGNSIRLENSNNRNVLENNKKQLKALDNPTAKTEGNADPNQNDYLTEEEAEPENTKTAAVNTESVLNDVNYPQTTANQTPSVFKVGTTVDITKKEFKITDRGISGDLKTIARKKMVLFHKTLTKPEVENLFIRPFPLNSFDKIENGFVYRMCKCCGDWFEKTNEKKQTCSDPCRSVFAEKKKEVLSIEN